MSTSPPGPSGKMTTSIWALGLNVRGSSRKNRAAAFRGLTNLSAPSTMVIRRPTSASGSLLASFCRSLPTSFRSDWSKPGPPQRSRT